jgi:phage tail-like protein
MKDQRASDYFESDHFERGYPPPAFYFAISIGNGSLIDDTAFSEVSGIGTEIETEAVVEGGENRFVHQLPKQVKHGQLELKRGIARLNSPLALWCKKTLEGEFATMIELQTVIVKLTGANGQVLRVWQFNDAYPVKWSVDPFNSTKNEVAVEKISLAYSYSQRRA